MKAHVDPEICIGCGLCADFAPEIFTMTDQGTAQAVAPGDEATVNAAIEACPVSAISQAEEE